MSKVTHYLALGAAAIGAFFATSAGQAFLHQYPHLIPIVGCIALIAGLYRDPKVAQ